MIKLVMELVKVARKGGGDRYEAEVEGLDESLVIYFPQFISRKGGQPRRTIEVEIK